MAQLASNEEGTQSRPKLPEIIANMIIYKLYYIFIVGNFYGTCLIVIQCEIFLIKINNTPNKHDKIICMIKYNNYQLYYELLSFNSFVTMLLEI